MIINGSINQFRSLVECGLATLWSAMQRHIVNKLGTSTIFLAYPKMTEIALVHLSCGIPTY